MRESLAIEVGQRLKGEDVVSALNEIRQKRGVPKLLFCDVGVHESDHGSLGVSQPRTDDFSRPGKPTDNAHVESFKWYFAGRVLGCALVRDPDGG